MIPDMKPFDEITYSAYPLTDLAACAMAVLGDDDVPLTIENITVALFQLFPTKFSLVGYPQYPDGMRANRTLLQMQPKYRNLATGSATVGYSLTVTGRRTAERLRAALASRQPKEARAQHDESAERGKGPARTIHDEDIAQEIRESELFRKYAEGRFDEAKGLDFLAMLGAFSHTPADVISKQLKNAVRVAEKLGDTELSGMLSQCRRRFAGLLKSTR